MKYKDEKGNVVIEASIVMTITVVMIAVLINLGIKLYNRNLMEAVAADTAVNLANVYSSTYRDPIYGYMDDSEFHKTELYRHVANALTASYDEKVERKGTWFYQYSLKKNSITKLDASNVEVDIVHKPGTLMQRQILVKLTVKEEAPLAAIWGGNNTATYTVEGRADCVDLLDYFNTIGTVKDCITSKLDKLVGTLTDIIEMFDLSSLEG